ncbi:MAG: hypothetical protein IFNCLDLE_01908 [Ignavibacteriaceae bacterium]|jgi:hypothetical protein|nr:hypothetical protein [Ignavibacteriaceae bacterium]WKZ73348.1 MAG: hypothetical protein QY308_03890 [Ignavibacteriaceae bacterium]
MTELSLTALLLSWGVITTFTVYFVVRAMRTQRDHPFNEDEE